MIFLPGILMPASLRYTRLLQELGDSVRPMVKELEAYASASPPHDYSIATEVEGISRAAEVAGFSRFHLYGHSAGGACSIAYAGAYPDRVLSVSLDEPATDFSEEDKAEMRQEGLDRLDGLSSAERMQAFMPTLLAPGVKPGPPPWGDSPPAWMASRPEGVLAFTKAIFRHELEIDTLRAFAGPVYYSFGSLSNPRWDVLRRRLATVFRDFRAERYEGLHHMNTSHLAEPARVAAALRRMWSEVAAPARDN